MTRYHSGMGTLALKQCSVEYRWASEVLFDGIRLEVLSNAGEVIFDISVSENGPATVNTFGKEVPVDLLIAAIEVAQGPR